MYQIVQDIISDKSSGYTNYYVVQNIVLDKLLCCSKHCFGQIVRLFKTIFLINHQIIQNMIVDKKCIYSRHCFGQIIKLCKNVFYPKHHFRQNHWIIQNNVSNKSSCCSNIMSRINHHVVQIIVSDKA